MSAAPQPGSFGLGVVRASNRHGWDYRRAAAALGPPVVPIIDAHAHLAGAEPCKVYEEVRRQFGVTQTYSMTQLAQCGPVRDLLGESVRFIAFPSFAQSDRAAAFREGFVKTIEQFRHDYGSVMLKLWASPRLRDLIPELKALAYGATDLAEIDSTWRIKACEVGQKLGMMFMVHIADPDTWFATKYSDPVRYGTKRQQYEGLERMLDRFTSPWIAAHMGGWPEDLTFLDGMLTRHPNLHLDTSATKWVIRALGSHPASETRAFFVKWIKAGRLLFGSDIVVQEDHLRPQKQGVSPMADLADSPEAAFDLYASRYWALRTMFETDREMDSPIADPDLMMVEPAKYDAMSAPRLRGIKLDAGALQDLYRGTVENVASPFWE